MLHERYLISVLLRTHPPPSHLRFISRSAVIEPTFLQRISRWDEEGFSSCLVRPCDHAATTTPPKCLSASVRFRINMLPSPSGCRLSLRVLHFRGHFCVRFRCGLITRSYPCGKCVGRLQHLGFPPCCYPSYRVLTFTLVGFIVPY